MSEKKIDIEDSIEVDWTSEKEHWNEYKLDDGTTMKVKLILKGVRRATKQYRPDGCPVYSAESMTVVRVFNVPEKLKKPKDSSSAV